VNQPRAIGFTPRVQVGEVDPNYDLKLMRAHLRLESIPPRVFVHPGEIPPWLEAPLSMLLKRQALGEPI